MKPLTSHPIIGKPLTELINYDEKDAQWVAEDCGLLKGKGDGLQRLILTDIATRSKHCVLPVQKDELRCNLNLHFFSWASLSFQLKKEVNVSPI